MYVLSAHNICSTMYDFIINTVTVFKVRTYMLETIPQYHKYSII